MYARRMRAPWAVGLLFSFVALTSCSSVGGSAVRTGAVHLPSYTGPVAIYATGKPPPNAVDLGVIEVHGAQQEASVDVLLPQFLARVAFIGGNIAVIEGTRARFDIQGRTHVEQFYYACNLGSTCSGTRVYSTADELMVLSMFGHAMSTLIQPPPGGPLMPAEDAGAPPPASTETPDAGVPADAAVPTDADAGVPTDAGEDASAPAPTGTSDGGAPPLPPPSPPTTIAPSAPAGTSSDAGPPITPPPATAPIGGT